MTAKILFTAIISLFAASHMAGQSSTEVCPSTERAKEMKEQTKRLLLDNLDKLKLGVFSSPANYVVQIKETSLARFQALCDVQERGFEQWQKQHPEAENYVMFSCSDDRYGGRVTMYYRSLKPIPQQTGSRKDYLKQLQQWHQRWVEDNALQLEANRVKILLQNGGFNTDGIDVSEYDATLFYCGEGAVTDPSERDWKNRTFTPQTANFACFVHDKQYLVLGMAKETADANFANNTYLELKNRGFSEEDARQLSAKYYLGVKWFGDAAYNRAQMEAQEKNQQQKP